MIRARNKLAVVAASQISTSPGEMKAKTLRYHTYDSIEATIVAMKAPKL